jgi:hypothetical protein
MTFLLGTFSSGQRFVHAKFFLHAKCKAVTTRSIALMPMNGMMMPPMP